MAAVSVKPSFDKCEQINFIFKTFFLVLLIDVERHLDWVYTETGKGKYKG